MSYSFLASTKLPSSPSVTWRNSQCRSGLILLLVFASCSEPTKPIATDEARKRAIYENKSTEQAAREWFYPRRIEDYFPGMDAVSQLKLKEDGSANIDIPDALLDKSNPTNAVQFKRPETVVRPPDLEPNQVLGRNTWMIWCAGNEGFWDWLATDNLGFIDLLKLVDSRGRQTRFRDSGAINEPGMEAAVQPDDLDLWLDLPQDSRLRQWRSRYLRQTFEEIAKGQHKSQRGLKKRIHGMEVDLYRGDAPENTKTPDYGYNSSASYLNGPATSEYQSNGYSAPGNNVATEDSGQLDSEYYDQRIPPPDIYGLSSGIIGLRLFPNPYFDNEARLKWNGAKYYNNKDYFSDPELVRPFRVGMSCGFCHASFHPLKPPIDVNEPSWENISGNIGAQYLSMRATVGNLLTPNLFAYHLLESQPRGTIDTSLIASDNINNPNTFISVFNLPQRGLVSFRNPPERLSSASASLPSLWNEPAVNLDIGHPDGLKPDDVQYQSSLKSFREWREVFSQQGVLEKVFASNDPNRYTPRILIDGSDSIGAWGALARVYLNIGSYWERWNQLHQPVLGLTPQQPFRIQHCQTNSVYWNATGLRVGAMRDYFLKATPPMPLLSTEGGLDRLVAIDRTILEEQSRGDEGEFERQMKLQRGRHVDVSQLQRGRRVFARNCIVCHSSIQPESSLDTLFGGKTDESTAQARKEFEQKHGGLIAERITSRDRWAQNGEFWEHDPGQWLRDSDYVAWAEEMVEKPAFWQWNYLSTDYRIPVTVVKTNAGRAMATNAMAGHMWDDFASESFKSMPSVGPIEYFNPYSGSNGKLERFLPRHRTQDAPAGGGGPGFYRVPSLISVWATAPLLHNNSLGLYNNDPSVNGRLDAFDDAIHKMLYPERRLLSSSYNGATAERLERDQGLIWRTTEDSYLTIEAKRLPFFARQIPLIGRLSDAFPWLMTVQPLWLPSSLLMLGALIILALSNSSWRGYAGVATLVIAAGLWFIYWCNLTFPVLARYAVLQEIRPFGLIVVILAAIGVVLLLPISRKWTRYLGYLSTTVSLVLGFVIYFSAGELGDLRLGPIPKGTPVNLIANINSEEEPKKLAKTVKTVIGGLAEIQSRKLDDDGARKVMREKIAPALMNVSKCPDFVMDHGHYFEWFKTMTDEDKEAVIELLKTL